MATGSRVVLIDDDPGLRRLVCLALTGVAERVEQADGCTDGWPRLLADPPDVALIDVRLRDGCGYRLLERALLDPRLAQTRIVAFTGSASGVEALRRRPRLEVLGKPFAIAELEKLVRWSPVLSAAA